MLHRGVIGRLGLQSGSHCARDQRPSSRPVIRNSIPCGWIAWFHFKRFNAKASPKEYSLARPRRVPFVPLAWRTVGVCEARNPPCNRKYQRHLYHSTTRGGKPLSASGQANRLAAARRSFRFLTRENVLLYNPASELELAKLEKRPPKDILSADGAERVLSQPDVASPLGICDRAILEMLDSTGMRRPELIELQRQHLDAECRIVAIRQGKGEKDRFIPIGERALTWTAKYLADVRPELEMAHVHTLFLDEAGQKLDPHRISRAVRAHVERSGVEKKGRCQSVTRPAGRARSNRDGPRACTDVIVLPPLSRWRRPQ